MPFLLPLLPAPGGRYPPLPDFAQALPKVTTAQTLLTHPEWYPCFKWLCVHSWHLSLAPYSFPRTQSEDLVAIPQRHLVVAGIRGAKDVSEGRPRAGHPGEKGPRAQPSLAEAQDSALWELPPQQKCVQEPVAFPLNSRRY